MKIHTFARSFTLVTMAQDLTATSDYCVGDCPGDDVPAY